MAVVIPTAPLDRRDFLGHPDHLLELRMLALPPASALAIRCTKQQRELLQPGTEQRSVSDPESCCPAVGQTTR